MGPQLKVQHVGKEICHPDELLWGSARSSCVAPIHFQLATMARFRVLSTCTCRAQGCCCRRRRCLPFWWASQGSAHCHPPPRSSPHDPWPPCLCPRPDYNVLSPLCHAAHAGSRNEVITARGLDCRFGTCPRQLLTVYWYKYNTKYIDQCSRLESAGAVTY
jgi:hypothetical protein